MALDAGGVGEFGALGSGAEQHPSAVVRIGSADRVAGRGEPVHRLAHRRGCDVVVVAELGQGLRAVLVQPGEHVERRVAEAAVRAFAAEPAVEAPHRRSHLTAEPGRAFASCTRLHESLVYLNTGSLGYLNTE